MALIPGTLPSDTCYGTPQDLLELFAQYLDIPAVALQSKVFFGTSSVGLPTDAVWIDQTTALNPILKLYVGGAWVDYVKNYFNSSTTVTIASGDYVLVSDTSDSGNTKKGLVSDIAALAVPAAGSITYPMLSTSATEANNVAKRTAKAWVNFDGTSAGPITPRDDFNVSTVGDNGTGDYTINFSSAIGHANYAVAGTSQPTTNVPSGLGISTTTSPTSSALRVVTWAGLGPSLLDSPIATVIVFG